MHNTKTIFLIIGIISIFGISIYYLSKNNNKIESMDSMSNYDKKETTMEKPMMEEPTMDKQDKMMNTDNTTMEIKIDTNEMNKMESYIPYSETNITAAAINKRVLFFYASWCPTCKSANTSFENNISMIPSGVTVLRVNYNDSDTDQNEKELARKYGITYQHTFVQIDENGNEITKWNGGEIKELLSNIK